MLCMNSRTSILKHIIVHEILLTMSESLTTLHGFHSPKSMPNCSASYGITKPLRASSFSSGENIPTQKEHTVGCSSEVWPFPDLLYVAQKSEIFSDSKEFVDRPLKFSMDETKRLWNLFLNLQDVSDLDKIDPISFRKFIYDITFEAGSDLTISIPKDWSNKDITWMDNIKSDKYRNWALFLNEQWKSLCMETSCKENLEQHSLLPLQRHFFIPGGRFREIYYFDSLLTVIGLICCNMMDSAAAQTNNLLDLIQQFGFVPNGNRQYYICRSQPPLLSEIVWDATKDVNLVKRALFLLIKEYEFWINDPHLIRIKGKDKSEILLSRYYANCHGPRPESFREDLKTSTFLPMERHSDLFIELATCAESGWDFSSRWFSDYKSPEKSCITHIAPVDLNAFLYQIEINISNFAEIVGDSKECFQKIALRFKGYAEKRKQILDEYFWDKETYQWHDYFASENDKHTNNDDDSDNKSEFASNFFPLFCGITPPSEDDILPLLERIESSKLFCEAGIAASLNRTGEQWDYPNAWPPVQHFIIDGLLKVANNHPNFSDKAYNLAKDIALRFLRCMYASYEKYGCMFEKYDATKIEGIGCGGEYGIQKGFGWSNGIALWLLNNFGHLL